ncbi:hypothetical protein ABH935_007188 [Catenulispora sp. GAS73]|uniref:hypothetical protein n=1 Tax=Catenulispora sp. GAS73 TaxID=3156269 RepID=UPI0035113398
MNADEIREIISEELRHIPRGDRGSAQNVLRSTYKITRAHSLKPGSEVPDSPDLVMEHAVASVRIQYPDFEPTLES